MTGYEQLIKAVNNISEVSSELEKAVKELEKQNEVLLNQFATFELNENEKLKVINSGYSFKIEQTPISEYPYNCKLFHNNFYTGVGYFCKLYTEIPGVVKRLYDKYIA